MSGRRGDTSGGHASGAASVSVGNNFGTINTQQGEAAASPSSSPSVSHGAAASGGGLLIVVLIIAGFVFSNSQEPFPTTGDPRPKGSKVPVLVSITDWLKNCTKAVIATPKTCPQSIDAPVAPDTSITWNLYGDPVESARIRFNKSKGRFNVLGSVVMVARYQESGEAVLRVRQLYYWAKINWRDGKAEVLRIGRHKGDPVPKNRIEKRDPRVPWNTLSEAVRGAFLRCMAAKRMPMPAGCPASSTSTLIDDELVTWTMDNDPLQIARPSFDAKFGVIHVKGSYSLTARGKFETASQRGNYDAVVVLDAGVPVVLDIRSD